jgi:hypothetical protein
LKGVDFNLESWEGICALDRTEEFVPEDEAMQFCKYFNFYPFLTFPNTSRE